MRLLIGILYSTFVNAWQTSMRLHERMAENRLKFAQRLTEMSDELAALVKEVEKNRKGVSHYICSLCVPRR
jgi:hypothetical protein